MKKNWKNFALIGMAALIVLLGVIIMKQVQKSTPIFVSENNASDQISVKAIQQLVSCDAKKELNATMPDKNTLSNLGLGNLLTEGYSTSQICFDSSSNRVVFILAKEKLTSPAVGIDPTCVDSCDQDVFGTIDAASGKVNSKLSVHQLGVYSESYNQSCLIDKVIPGATQATDKILFYCGSGESGGMTNWYQYEFDGDKLTSVQNMTTLDPEKFEIKSKALLNMFQYKSNSEMR